MNVCWTEVSYKDYSIVYYQKRTREIVPLSLDKSRPSTFFDGACRDYLVGLGFNIYINENQKFMFKSNLGDGTHNQEELVTFYYLLKLSFQNSIHSLQVHGEFALVINHLNSIVGITSLSLHAFSH